MNEIKKLFDSRLQDYLKCRLDIPKGANILKKNIKYKWTEENKVDGFVGFDYIQKARGIKYADFYSHPTLLVIFLAKKHGMRLEDINNHNIFNKRLSKNLAFTKAVAEKMLK